MSEKQNSINEKRNQVNQSYHFGGFYDREVKRVCESCPRLMVKAINSIFKKNHSEETEVKYLNREQVGDEQTSSTFMDMILQIEDSKYHLEFQLLEDNMAIRMYEYAVKETISAITEASNQSEESNDKYMIEIFMPEQAVIFLAGANKKDKIKVVLHLPDQKVTSYELDCISAARSVEDLIKAELYFLIPFQQVQLNKRMNEIKNCSLETKRKMANELYKFHKEVKSQLESLEKNGILKSSEVEFLMNTFYNLEKYISEKDKDVKEVVDTMGDVDYIAWSDRIEARGKKAGIEEGKKAGIEEGKKAGIKEARNEAKEEARKSAKRLLKKGLSIDDIAECLPQLSYDELRQIEAEVMSLA
jgi:hypothetical protein